MRPALVVCIPMVLLLAGCSQAPPHSAGLAQLSEGDAWVWLETIDDGDPRTRIEVVHQQQDLPWNGTIHPTWTVARGFQDLPPPGPNAIEATALTIWQNATGAVSGFGAQYEQPNDIGLDRYSIWRPAPCPDVPGRLLVGSTWSVTCRDVPRDTGVDGFVLFHNAGSENRSFSIVALEEIVVPAGTFSAYKIERTFTGQQDKTKYQHTDTVWYAPTACNIIRLVNERGFESELKAVRCSASGIDTGIDESVLAAATPVGFPGGDALEKDPVIGRCILRQVAIGVAGEAADVFDGTCTLREAMRVNPERYETIRILVSWETEGQLPNAFTQVHVSAAGISESGSEQPVVLEIPAQGVDPEALEVTIAVDGATHGDLFWVDFHMVPDADV